MNYGKKNLSKKQKKISSKTPMKKKRAGVRIFKSLLLVMLLFLCLGIAGGALFVKKIIDDTPEISSDNIKPQGYSTSVFNQDGSKELERFVAANSNRIYKSIDQIPLDLQHAFVALEDTRFYEHNGIDPQGIARAFIKGISQGYFSEGGSTLTQQLLKNTVFTNFTEEKTFFDRLERKIQEQYLALKIEKEESKDEILENYMNTINLGQNTLGVQTAAKRYFNKDVSELTLNECAVIAGITKNPTGYNPITHPEKNDERRQKVLKDMLAQEYINQQQHDEALADTEVYSRIQTANAMYTEEESPYTYFIDALIAQIQDDLIDQYGYSATQAYNQIFSGGLSIYATQDPEIQAACDEEMNDPDNYPDLVEFGLSYALTVTRADGTVENFGSQNIKKYMRDAYGDPYGLVFSSEEDAQAYIAEWKTTIAQEGDKYDERVTLTPQPQASVVVMDQYTGQVKALTGGRGEKTANRSFNRATESARQPGSCFKVLSAFAPAIDSAGYTLATTVKDEEYFYQDGTPVRNWWGDSYKGDQTIRSAITQSMNVVAVKTLTDITPQLGFDYLTRFGFTTLVKSKQTENGIYSDIQQSTALGGITDGVYNIELTAAYATIADRGVYHKPVLYTKVIDHDGKVLLDNTTPETRTVLKDSTAALLTSAMEDVFGSSSGTGYRYGRLESGMPQAGKTGTTTSDVDVWVSGYTPYYTCSVWGGYDDNKPLNNTSYHLVIWRKIMDRVNQDLPYKDFEVPADVTEKSVCSITGKLATSSCPAVTELFAAGTVPDDYCSGHVTQRQDTTEETTTTTTFPDGSSVTTHPDGSTTTTPGNSSGNTTNTPDVTTPPNPGTNEPTEEHPDTPEGE